MVQITDANGGSMYVDPSAVLMIGGAGSAGVMISQVFGLSMVPFFSREAPESLIAKLVDGSGKGFAKLTRPDGSPVWFRLSAVVTVASPVSTNHGAGPVGAVVTVRGNITQAVQEDVQRSASALRLV